jgi:PAS domain S-box-containing protein
MQRIQSILKKQLNPNSFSSLLDRITLPALIWNSGSKKAVLSNRAFHERFGYSLLDLEDMEFGQFFPGHELPITEQQLDVVKCISEDGDDVTIGLEVFLVDPDSELVLTVLNPLPHQEEPIYDEDLASQWEAVSILVKEIGQADSARSLQRILQAGKVLTHSNFMALYLPPEGTSHRLDLEQLYGEGQGIPDFIPRSEFGQLRVPLIWRLGTHISSRFHQYALSNQLAFLATIPLDPASPQFGLIVAGSSVQNPAPYLGQQLDLLRLAIGNHLGIHDQLVSLRTDQEKLASQLELYQDISDHILDGVILVDKDQNVVAINNQACAILGFSTGEAVQKGLDKILLPAGETNLLDSVWINAGGILTERGDVLLRRRDGEEVLVELRVLAVSSLMDNLSHVIFLSDQQEKNELARRTKQLQTQANIGEMIAVFSHEVRNPINNIRMGVENLAAVLPEDAEYQEDLNRILMDIDRVTELMKNILTGYRSREYQKATLDLNHLLDGLAYRWQGKVQDQGIKISVFKDERDAYVNGDKRSLEQVFNNIIQNGVNAIQPNPGEITLKVSVDEELAQVGVDISDSGPGIPDEIMDKIFNLYFTTKEDGHGIGLAITKQIVDAHNGQLDVNSVPGGTVFRITLPYVAR